MGMAFGTSTPIDVRAQDDLIRQRGEWLRYFPGARCPCGSEPNKPDYACPNCQGLGHFYPHGSVWMNAIVAQINLNRDPFGIPGFAIPGDLYMSVRPTRGKLPQVYDWDMALLTGMVEGIPFEGEDVLADPSGIDVVQEHIVKLFSAYSIDPYDTSAVNKIVEHVPGVDFDIVPKAQNQVYPQAIQWFTQNRPRPGSKYTIKYSACPAWVIFNPPKPHVERFVPLGQSCLIRRRSIVLANNAQG